MPASVATVGPVKCDCCIHTIPIGSGFCQRERYSVSSSPCACCTDADKELVSAVCWSPSNELLACSDDKTISRWSADGEFSGLVVNELPAYVTDISYLPSTGTAPHFPPTPTHMHPGGSEGCT
jgi:WD40 repeat protein